MLIGDGHLKNKIEEKINILGIKENVILTGAVNNAFEYCKSLDSIIIPDSVNYIGYYAFLNCSSPTLYVPQNSYAHQYAIRNKLTYTTY